MMDLIDKDTIQKFDVPGPRYTSYPTAPNWSETVTESVYQAKLYAFSKSDKTLSLYIHIPFCESMCTFCACSVIIRPQNAKYAEEYLSYLFKEIELVAQAIGNRKEIRQLHWGGGTPTFLNEEQIKQLFLKVKEHFNVSSEAEIAVEIDPRTITDHKLEVLKELGFNRISLGVQDFDAKVQEAVNRIQPYELVKRYVDKCRALNFHSVNFDLIYGLPYQTKETFKVTMDQVLSLSPDRIALYSFAYVPWLKKHQTKIDTAALPSREEKLDIFISARMQFLENEYQAIAMDHFAKADDELARSFNAGVLYRNFMGYTVKPADEYLGLGLSSIGFLENTYIQNKKVLREYYQSLNERRLPVERGKELSGDDIIRHFTINALMCQFELDKGRFKDLFMCVFDDYFADQYEHIQKCQEDGLLEVRGNLLKVTELGKIFIRNIAMGFDAYLKMNKEQKFSQTI